MKSNYINLDKQRGLALLLVLLVLAIMSLTAASMVEDTGYNIRRISHLQQGQQNYHMAIGAEDWAAIVLKRDAENSETDHLNEDWANLSAAVEVNEGQLSVSVIDAQGLFNINNLALGKESPWYAAFVRLLDMVNLEAGLADAVMDWVDSDIDVSGANGAEDSHYLLSDPPYRAANKLMTDISELLLVSGFDEEKLIALGPYITALPNTNSRININTSPADLLRILGNPLLGLADAESLVDARGEEGYEDTEIFLVQTALAGQGDIAQQLISLNSQYFIAIAQSKYGELTLSHATLLFRKKSNNNDEIIIKALTRKRIS